MKSIMAGEQYSTINKDTRKLVEHAITMVKDLQAGKTPEINDDKSYNNTVKIVPAYLLEPVIVTKENVKTAYVDDPVLGPMTKSSSVLRRHHPESPGSASRAGRGSLRAPASRRSPSQRIHSFGRVSAQQPVPLWDQPPAIPAGLRSLGVT